MGRCTDIEPLITSYVDQEASPASRIAVDSHLDECPACRRRANVERQTRDLLRGRADQLTARASEGLHHRCRRLATSPRRGFAMFAAHHRVALALAATLLLALAGLIGYGMSVPADERLVAQLALDHVKCFALTPSGTGGRPASLVQAGLRAQYGWDVRVPPSSSAQGLTLVDGRRCFYADGRLAHILYRRGRQAVSLFVLPHEVRPPDEVQIMGYSAIVWSRDETTYVVLAQAARHDVQEMARYIRSQIE
jgi:anti-sigma factor RsiW